MKKENVQFTGSLGDRLDAVINYPLDQKAHTFVLFAHCFTCNKNYGAVRNIVQGLNQNGFAVLSFDFTGLGSSEGDFADSNFSTTIDDLLEAAEFLKSNYRAPSLLVGHSLGGTAALYAAQKIDSVAAVASIGSPAEAKHVQNLFADDVDHIAKEGESVVNIGGRNFTIKEQFLKDLQAKNAQHSLNSLRKALMVMHSPQDKIVGIENAKLIFEMAHHPKSFISLDGADHLLSNKEDSLYAGNTIAAWAHRYLPIDTTEKPQTDAITVASIGNKSEGLTTQIVSENHHLLADEPYEINGNNLGPSPYGLLTAALASCTAITLRMYANQKGWDVSEIQVHVDQSHRHAEDSKDCEKKGAKITVFNRTIVINGELTEDQKNRMIEIAKKCPVHKTLESSIEVK